MVTGLRALGWSVSVRELDAGFPRPTSAALEHAARVLAELRDGSTVIADGLALGAMPAQAEHEASRLSIVALVHSLLAADVGIDRDTAQRFEASERRALAAAGCVVVAGDTLVEALVNYGVTRDRIAVVHPGADRAPLAHGSEALRRHGEFHLLSVATLNAGKGHDVLFRALAALPHRNWRLTCAGSLDRDPATVSRVRGLLRDADLEDRVSLAGELDAAGVAACYDRADLFVLATLSETHPLVIAEALARGLPIVSTTTGAIPDLVGRGADAAGLLVAPGDADAFADALSRVMSDGSLRDRLAEGARRMRDRLPTWDEAARRMASVLERRALTADR